LRPLLVIEQQPDALRCHNDACAALVPVPPPGRLATDAGCAHCGRR
jgi:hypothetical protein